MNETSAKNEAANTRYFVESFWVLTGLSSYIKTKSRSR